MQKDNDKIRKGRCIVVCAGDLEVSDIPVRQEDTIVAVDGGYLYCRVLELAPDIVIGDFDSLEEQYMDEIRAAYTQADPETADGSGYLIQLQPQKDETDTLAALQWGLGQGYREFHLYGAFGGRLEHTIANLQCLLFLKRAGAAGYIWDGTTMTTLIRDESLTFRKEMEGLVSVFAVGGSAEGVREEGLKYKLQDMTLTDDFPMGISNEFIGEKAEIAVKCGTLLIIVRWE